MKKLFGGLVIIAMMQFLSGGPGPMGKNANADGEHAASAIMASLAEKIGRDMEIINMIDEGDSIFGPRYLAQVCPMDEPARKFYATYDKKTGEVKDTYITTVVADGFSQRVKKAAQRQWPGAVAVTSVSVAGSVLNYEYAEEPLLTNFIRDESPLIATRIFVPAPDDFEPEIEAEKVFAVSQSLAEEGLDSAYVIDYLDDMASGLIAISNGDMTEIDGGAGVRAMAAFSIKGGKANTKSPKDVAASFYGLPFALNEVLSVRPFDRYSRNTHLSDDYKHEELFEPYTLISGVYRLDIIGKGRLVVNLEMLKAEADEIQIIGVDWNSETRTYFTRPLDFIVIDDQSVELEIPNRAFAVAKN